MARAHSLQVELVAVSDFKAPQVDWELDPEATPLEQLIEFAGRACYETFDKPNPRTARNAAYIRHLMEVGHFAVFEHATATMYIRGLSRSATHELLRHRHFSFSQLSQRYVPTQDQDVVIPDLIDQDPELRRMFLNAVDDARFVYEELLSAFDEKLASEPNALLRKKQARQAARAVLPNATETKIVVTGNLRAWRHFIGMRASEHADVEIRQLAVRCLEELQAVAPVAVSDFEFSTLADGTRMATSPYVLDA